MAATIDALKAPDSKLAREIAKSLEAPPEISGRT